MSHAPRVALVDVDGTLVDSNYHHALAWSRALRRYDLTVPLWRIHRHIGMGGDQLVPALAGDEAERAHGDALREAWGEELAPFLEEISPLPGAQDLLVSLRDQGWRTVLASSGKPEHVETFLDLLEARELVAAWTTSEDVGRTKPHPEILEVALDRLGLAVPLDPGCEVVVLGDSTWDAQAAVRLGLRSLGVLTGGFARDELLAAGADDVVDSLDDVAAVLSRRP